MVKEKRKSYEYHRVGEIIPLWINHSWLSGSKAISIDKFVRIFYLVSTLTGMVSKFYFRCRKYGSIVYHLEDYVLI